MIVKKIIMVVVISIMLLFLCGNPAFGSSEFTAARSISDVSVNAGNSFTVTVDIYFQTEIDAPKLEENIPEGWIISEGDYGDSTFSEDGSLATWIWAKTTSQGERLSVSYNVEVPATASGGTYSIYGAVSGIDHNSDDDFEISIIGDQNVNIIQSSQSSDTSSSSSSGGGGGGGTSGEEYENILKKEVKTLYINKDSNIVYEFDTDENAIDYIKFRSLKNSGQISSTIEVLNGKSSFADSNVSGNIYQNMNIWVGKSGFSTSGNIEDITIGFKVAKSWIENNGVSNNNILMYRYSNGTWNELDTTLVDEDDSFAYFEASTPGFSPFAISVKDDLEAVDEGSLESTLESTTDIDAELAENSSADPESEPQSTPGPGFLASLLIIGSVSVYLKKRM